MSRIYQIYLSSTSIRSIIGFISIALIGFFNNLYEMLKIDKRIRFVRSFEDNFRQLTKGVLEKHRYEDTMRDKFLEDVDAFQIELGQDGVVDYYDPVLGMKVDKYQIFVNFDQEIQMTCGVLCDNTAQMEQFRQIVETCNAAINRHIGNLKRTRKECVRNLLNPIRCFSKGIRLILSIPIIMLQWLGIISADKRRKAESSTVMTIMSALVSVVGFVASIITIVLGWNEFVSILRSW